LYTSNFYTPCEHPGVD
jgi:phage protein D